MLELFSYGNIQIHLFGVMIAIGILMGYFIVDKEIKRKKLEESILTDLLLYGLISAVIGARLFYVVIFNPVEYLNNPMSILKIQNGGLSIQGALFAGILVCFIYLKRKKVNVFDYADAFVPGIAFGQFIGRIGCDVFGIPMEKTYFWGVMNKGQWVHPVQIYEGLLNLILFTALWRMRRHLRYKGQLFSLYIIGFGIIRGFVEFFRVNPIIFSTVTVAHLMSLIMIIIGTISYRYTLKKAELIKQNTANDKEMSHLKFAVIILLIAIIGLVIYYGLR